MHQDRLAERQSGANLSPNPNSLLRGKNTGIFRYSGANGTRPDQFGSSLAIWVRLLHISARGNAPAYLSEKRGGGGI